MWVESKPQNSSRRFRCTAYARSRSVPWRLLDALSDDDRARLLSQARRRRFGRNDVIFHEGDSGDTLHLVAEGHVAIRMSTPLGDVATVRIIRSGEFFG